MSKPRTGQQEVERAFEKKEREKAFETFMKELDAIDPVEPVTPSVDAIRMLREGSDHEVADKRTFDAEQEPERTEGAFISQEKMSQYMDDLFAGKNSKNPSPDIFC